MTQATRYKQRLENLNKALARLNTALAIPRPDETDKAGIIQFFEVCFELSWKTIKDYLESLGHQVAGPRPAIKKAFEIELIANGETWLTMLEDRNKTTHLYDEAKINTIIDHIRTTYTQQITHLANNLGTKDA